MASRGDSDRYEFGDSASVHGLLAPWSEDQTTTTYSAEHMHSLRQHVRSTSPLLQAGAPSFRESSWDDSPEIIEIREATMKQVQASQSWEEDLAEYRQDTGAAIAAAWSEAERELQARKEQQQLTAAKTPKQSGAYAKQTLPAQTGQFAPVARAQPARRQSVAFPAPQPTAAQTQPARPMRAPRTLPQHGAQPRAPQPTAAMRAPRTLPGPATARPSLPAPMLLPTELDDAPLKRESIWVGPAGYAVAGALGLLAAVFFGQTLFDPGNNVPVASSAPRTPAPAPVAPAARVETDPVAAAAANSLPSQPSAASTHASGKLHASASTTSPSSDGSVHMTWRERRAARLAAEAEARAERQNATAAPASEPSAPTPATATTVATHETSHSAATRDVLADDDKADDLLAPSTPAPAPAKAATSDDSSASDSAAHGTLRINSRPWSQVYVDGKLIGNTPQMSIDVKSGAHSVRLVNTEFSMSKVIELNVAPGEVVSRVEMLDE